MTERIEILVHTGAPCSVRDDKRYRQQAKSFLAAFSTTQNPTSLDQHREVKEKRPNDYGRPATAPRPANAAWTSPSVSKVQHDGHHELSQSHAGETRSVVSSSSVPIKPASVKVARTPFLCQAKSEPAGRAVPPQPISQRPQSSSEEMKKSVVPNSQPFSRQTDREQSKPEQPNIIVQPSPNEKSKIAFSQLHANLASTRAYAHSSPSLPPPLDDRNLQTLRVLYTSQHPRTDRTSTGTNEAINIPPTLTRREVCPLASGLSIRHQELPITCSHHIRLRSVATSSSRESRSSSRRLAPPSLLRATSSSSFVSSNSSNSDSPQYWTVESPPSPTSSARFVTHLAPSLRKLAENHSLASCYRPLFILREPGPSERGHWTFKIQIPTWSANATERFWRLLTDFVRSGRAPPMTRVDAVSVRSDKQRVRLYCWGETLKEMWLMVFALSGRRIRGAKSRWVGADGSVAIQME